MDVFSATNKQVTQPAINTSMDIRSSARKVAPSQKIEENHMPSKHDIRQKLDKTVEHLNEHMKSLDTNITFGFDDKADAMFVNVVERSTGKVIRRIPTEEAMKISEKMKEIVGMIFDKKG